MIDIDSLAMFCHFESNDNHLAEEVTKSSISLKLQSQFSGFINLKKKKKKYG